MPTALPGGEGHLVDSFYLYAGAFGPEYPDVIGAAVDVALRAPRTDQVGMVADLSLLGSAGIIEGLVRETQSFLVAARRSYLDLVVDQIEGEGEGEIFEVPEYFGHQGICRWEPGPANRAVLEVSGACATGSPSTRGRST